MFLMYKDKQLTKVFYIPTKVDVDYVNWLLLLYLWILHSFMYVLTVGKTVGHCLRREQWVITTFHCIPFFLTCTLCLLSISLLTFLSHQRWSLYSRSMDDNGQWVCVQANWYLFKPTASLLFNSYRVNS